MTLLVVSPHLDDAVLSLGQLIAGHPTVEVVTVLTATPPSDAPALTEFDRRSGFASSIEAMDHRRREDRRACSTLDATWNHLGGLDSQYGGHVDRGEVRDVLERVLAEPRLAGRRLQGIVGPLGLEHPDHLTVAHAVLDAGRRRKVPTFVYAELPYAAEDPFQLVERWHGVQKAEGPILVETFLGTGDRSRKRRACELYESQRWALEVDHAMAPEHVWEVTWR